MSLRDDIAADLGTVFSTEDFAQSATYYPCGSKGIPDDALRRDLFPVENVPIIMAWGDSDQPSEMGQGIEDQCVAWVRASDIPHPRKYDLVDVNPDDNFTQTEIDHFINDGWPLPETLWMVIRASRGVDGLFWRLELVHNVRIRF